MPTTLTSTILWIIAIAVLWIAVIFFIRKSKKSDVPSQKNMFLGIGLFFGLYSLTRAFFIIGWYLTFDESSQLYDIFWRIATIIGMIGFTFLIFVLERYPLERRTKYIGTILGCIALILSLALGSEMGLLVLAVSLPILGVLILALYGYLAKITEGTIRRRAILDFLGILIILLGIMFDTNIAYDLIFSINPFMAPIVQGIFAPSLFIAGVLVFLYSNHQA